MIAFFTAAAILLLLGYALFIPVLTGKPRAERTNRATLNVLLHEQRQQELAREVADNTELARLGIESERSLLDDLETAPDSEKMSHDSGQMWLRYALLSIPVCALALYQILGRPDLLGKTPDSLSASPEFSNSLPDMESRIQALATRLKEKPDDLEGWVLLGRSLQTTKQPQKAVSAYEYALALEPGNVDIKSLLAEALAEAHQGSMLGKPTELVTEILKQNPSHQNGLWMAGIAAVERKEISEAIRYWTKLKEQFSPESKEAQHIQNQLTEIETLLHTQDQKNSVESSRSTMMRIRVKVTLADRFTALPESTVFIFARAVDGPPMPLAVVRKQVKELPLEVELDDSMALAPGMTLSSFKKVVIGARISKSNQAIASPGDLEGLTEPVLLKEKTGYTVTIDHVVEEK